MIRTVPKNYLGPWSTRRETAGLMGTFLVFLIGFPSHSEPMLDSAKHLVSQLIQLVLVFLGLSTPVTQAPSAAVAPTAIVSAAPMKHHRAAMKIDPYSMILRRDPILHHYTYLFKGNATLNGQACQNASVLVRLLTGERTVAKGTVTEADGSYFLEVAIDAEDRAPVDWTVEAYTPEFKKVELSGRQIVQRESEPGQEQQDKSPIIVTNPVEFVVTLSK